MRKNKVFKRSQNKSSRQKTSNEPSIIGSIAHGMVGGFGAGVGIEGARSVIDSLSGSKNEQNQQPIQQDNCVFEKKQLEKCISNGNECKDFIDLLNNCYKAK